jgi:hypothetical protein
MPTHPRRLLFLLVQVSLVVAVSWATAHARGSTPSPNVAPSSLSALKSGAQPTSGEPDVGQSPRLNPVKGSASPAPGWSYEKPGRPHSTRFSWIVRLWMFRFTGVW